MFELEHTTTVEQAGDHLAILAGWAVTASPPVNSQGGGEVDTS